jgi:hypothetical protein
MPRATALRAAVAAAALAAAVGACSGDGGSPSAATTQPAGTEAPSPEGAIALRLGDVTVESLGEPVEMDRAVQRDVLAQVQRYVDEATLRPLVAGEPADLEGMFSDGLTERIAARGADRGALTDDAVPAATEPLTTRSKPVHLSALSNGLGGWVMVGATLDYTVETDVGGSPVTIHRFGDIYLSPADDGWVITAYNVAVTRETIDGHGSDGASAGSGSATTEAGTPSAAATNEEEGP